MLHYNPQHVSSSTLLISRRTNCIITATGIVTLRKRPYSMLVESGPSTGEKGGRGTTATCLEPQKLLHWQCCVHWRTFVVNRPVLTTAWVETCCTAKLNLSQCTISQVPGNDHSGSINVKNSLMRSTTTNSLCKKLHNEANMTDVRTLWCTFGIRELWDVTFCQWFQHFKGSRYLRLQELQSLSRILLHWRSPTLQSVQITRTTNPVTQHHMLKEYILRNALWEPIILYIRY